MCQPNEKNRILIDSEKIEKVKSVKFEAKVGEIPEFEIGIVHDKFQFDVEPKFKVEVYGVIITKDFLKVI